MTQILVLYSKPYNPCNHVDKNKSQGSCTPYSISNPCKSVRSSGNESSTDHEDHKNLSRTIRVNPRDTLEMKVPRITRITRINPRKSVRSSGNESSTNQEDHEDLSRTIRKSPRYAVKKSPTPQDAEDISNTNSLS